MKNRNDNKNINKQGYDEQQGLIHDENTSIHKVSNGETDDSLSVTLHFCFLVHGWKGMACDFTYTEKAIKMAKVTYLKSQKKSSSLESRLIVHNCIYNEKNTDDGIAGGGKRIANETIDTIQKHLNANYDNKLQSNITDITLSFLGASLGGMYVRYALGILQEKFTNDSKDCRMNWSFIEKNADSNDLSCSANIHFNTFFGLVTPHIGLATCTYVPLPRTAQGGLCRVLGSSVNDIFCFNDIVWNMCTSPKFLNPLASFRKRITYINAYHTDFSVPTDTAAFIHKESSYPHYFLNDETVNENNDVKQKFFIATVMTKRKMEDEPTKNIEISLETNNILPSKNQKENVLKMCESLDSLGWTKTFIDTRYSIPFGINLNIIQCAKNIFKKSSKTNQNQVLKQNNNPLLEKLKKKTMVQSKDLSVALSSPFATSDIRITLPMGHKMIGACSRDSINTFMFQNGTPIVDRMAYELVYTIFSWKQ